MKRIYFIGDEDDLPCEAEEGCDNTATYRIEDRTTGEDENLCAEHKNTLKAAGLAE